MAINKPLIGQDSSGYSSGEDAGGVVLKLHDCVCSKYENMKHKMRNCDMCENSQVKYEKEAGNCAVDPDKDVDESIEDGSRNIVETFGRKAEYARTFEAYATAENPILNTFRDNDKSGCDIIKTGAADVENSFGSHGNGFDKTGFGFYGDPREFCLKQCSGGKQGANMLWDNSIEDCGTLGPSGGCCNNYPESVIKDGPYNTTDKNGLFVKDHAAETQGDIDKILAGNSNEEVRLEYLSLSGCYKITDRGLR